MKVLETLTGTPPVISSKYDASWERVLVEDTDTDGGLSVWMAYKKGNTIVKDCIVTPSPERVTRKVAKPAKMPPDPAAKRAAVLARLEALPATEVSPALKALLKDLV